MNLDLIECFNNYGSSREPFFFMISYDLTKFIVEPLNSLSKDIQFELNCKTKSSTQKILLKKFPFAFEVYKKKFDLIQEEIAQGNSYLLNLTAETKVQNPFTLEEIYNQARSKFKLKYKDKFICFSPERFVQIKNNRISTYPMKGTIDASIANAKELLLNNDKEIAEHAMVVDLLRNDLSMIAKNVRVDEFRYIDTVQAGDKTLLQTSSEISGELNKNWSENLGNIMTKLLPAGSTTGTPKKKTIEILKKIEAYERNYYTGIFGVYDGENLDSSVMIRFIEKTGENEYVYKSGGGVTSDSDVHLEYQELLDKIYLPF